MKSRAPEGNCPMEPSLGVEPTVQIWCTWPIHNIHNNDCRIQEFAIKFRVVINNLK